MNAKRHKKLLKIEDPLIYHRIFTFLIYSESITKLSLVCSSWKNILSDEEFWKYLLLSNFHNFKYLITKPYFFTFETLCYKAYDFMEIQYFTFYQEESIWLEKRNKILKETGFKVPNESKAQKQSDQFYSQKLDDDSELVKISDSFHFCLHNPNMIEKPNNFNFLNQEKLQKEEMKWNDFVPDILNRIFLFSSIEEFGSLSLVCRYWCWMLNRDSEFWEDYFLVLHYDYKSAALKKMNIGMIVKTWSCNEFHVKYSIHRSFSQSINKLDDILSERRLEILDFYDEVDDDESEKIQMILNEVPENKNEDFYSRAIISPRLGAPGIKNYGHIKLKTLNHEYHTSIKDDFPTPESNDIFLGILTAIQLNDPPKVIISRLNNSNFADDDVIALFEALLSKGIAINLLTINIINCPCVKGSFIQKLIDILIESGWVCESLILRGRNLDPENVQLLLRNLHKINLSYHCLRSQDGVQE
jgi:hypothetical protein